ncbi:hypothetical protein DFH28DRAFT_1027534 [Melampsora americana]|nr:hypothetical protein DFH28DRAFT_1027534 [Melampsora americana]
MLNLRVGFSLSFLTFVLLTCTSALQDDHAVQLGLTGQPGCFDLNSLPKTDIVDGLDTSNQVEKQAELGRTTQKSSVPESLEHVIISRTHTPDDFQAQDISSTSNFGIHDELEDLPRRSAWSNQIVELYKVTKSQNKISKVFQSAPAIEQERILEDSTEHLTRFASGSNKIKKANSKTVLNQDHDHHKDIRFRIRSFQDHVPIPLVASASIFYTERTLGRFCNFLETDTLHKYPSWTSVWTRQTISPFVYFVMTCNPSYYMWERIEDITMRVWKVYHAKYIHQKPTYNKENLAQFLVWHTEVMSHVARSSDLIEQSARPRDQTLNLPRPKFSSVPRMVSALLGTAEYKRYTSSISRKVRNYHLNRYVGKDWNKDAKKYYPGRRYGYDSQSSLWVKWNLKSEEIYQNAHNIHWPLETNELIEKDKNVPVLLVREDSRLFNDVEGSNIRDFVTKHSEDFLQMSKYIQRPKRSKLRSIINEEEVVYGLNYFLNLYQEHYKDQKVPEEKEYSLDLLSEFLEQDPESKEFGQFWSRLEIYKRSRLLDNRQKKKLLVLKQGKIQNSKRVSREEEIQEKDQPRKKRVLREEDLFKY